MKKNVGINKLSLNKATVAGLNNTKQSEVKGGAGSQHCITQPPMCKTDDYACIRPVTWEVYCY